MNRIEKDWKDLDFDSVDFDSGNWGWCRGGRPLNDNEFAICNVTDDLVETCYKMPKCINRMLLAQYEYGKDDKLKQIQAALGIE
jgi:hypothetical protein